MRAKRTRYVGLNMGKKVTPPASWLRMTLSLRS